jgi:hypothetical protein
MAACINLCYRVSSPLKCKLPGKVTGAVPPICGEQGFLADPNEMRRIRPGMPILLNQLRLPALSAAFCVGWFKAVVAMAENAEDGGNQFWLRLPALKEIGV